MQRDTYLRAVAAVPDGAVVGLLDDPNGFLRPAVPTTSSGSLCAYILHASCSVSRGMGAKLATRDPMSNSSASVRPATSTAPNVMRRGGAMLSVSYNPLRNTRG